MMFAVFSFIYWVIRPFGPAAQAGFGIGSRVMQAIFLPCMAIAFAVAPVAGQNFGAKLYDRVRATFNNAALMSIGIMLCVTLLCQWQPSLLIRGFTSDPAVIAVGSNYLRIISLNFMATGLTFSCSGLLQALGNTVPSLLSSASRIVTFMLPVAWLATQPGFSIVQVWYFSLGSVAVQALLSFLLVRWQLTKRLV
jgi:Na+-driven multidrug efflux pump